MRDRIVSQAHDLRSRLADWYTMKGRDLPWRRTRDPYAILVSEVMLQQTQVATVIPYYERFLKRFPTAAALAEADETEVMSLWAGLGYYRRARMLQEAARSLVRDHAGGFPQQMTAIRDLPGIGDYTAGAIASFAFNAPEAVVDANVSRVLARVFCFDKPLESSAAKASIWKWARALVPPDGARTHNNALMELGATVCKPDSPRCGECPLERFCLARILDKVSSIPFPKAKPRTILVSTAGIVLGNRGAFLVRPVPEGNWHSGMWEFPQERVPEGIAALDVANRLACGALKRGIRLHPFAEFAYTVTRHRVTLAVFTGIADLKRLPRCAAGGRWLPLEEIAALPLGAPQKRIVNLLQRDSEWPFEP